MKAKRVNWSLEYMFGLLVLLLVAVGLIIARTEALTKPVTTEKTKDTLSIVTRIRS